MALRSPVAFCFALPLLAVVACSGSSAKPGGTGDEPTSGQAPGSAAGGNGSGSSAGTGNGIGSGSGSTSGSTGSKPPAAEAQGCDGAKLLATPEDTGARGPWAVGARTGTVAGLRTEIWYPAKVGSEAGKAKLAYDIREHLSADDAKKIPDSENPLQECDCYRDLALDEAHGPYPVVVFLHGTASFRTQSLTQATHWASRGFVVVAADHPGLELKDLLSLGSGGGGGGGGGGFGGNQQEDAGKLLDALAKPEGDLAFLANRIDVTRVGMAGHSAGGGAIAGLGSRAGVRVLIPMAAGGTQAGAALESSLLLGGQDDGIARYSRTQSAFTSSPKKKRLVGLAKAGHLAFSDLCAIGADKGGILKIAQDNGVNVPFFISFLATDGCKQGQLPPADGWAVVNAATSAVLEETLTCSKTAAAQLQGLKGRFPAVGEYQEEL